MIPRFALARPRSLDEAFEAFARSDGDAAWLAGGTELLQVMKMGLAGFGTLIDLKAIPGLAGVAPRDGGGLRIGAGTTHRELERSPIVADRVPALAGLERRVANVRVRNQGTIGGNLAFAEPHSDPATFLLAAGATVELASSSGTRRLSIDEFVLGPLTTAREPDEVLTAIDIPGARRREGRGYAKIAFFERPAVSVAVSVRLDDGAIAEARVAVGSIVESPVVVAPAGEALVGADVSGPGQGVGSGSGPIAAATDAATEAFDALDAIPDLNGSADYKRHLAGVLLRRALDDAVAEAARA